MKKRFFAVLTALLLLSSCGAEESAGELTVPILDESGAPKLRTATVTTCDLEQKTTVGAKVGYIYADKLYIDFESNILEYCVNYGQKLSEGDPIAIFDSSSLDYDYNNQKALADHAKAAYLSAGGEAARLESEIEAKKLEYVEYKKDCFTVRAPYDCTVIAAEYFQTGTVVPEGTLVCTVARPDDIYVYTTENAELFNLGMPAAVRFGAGAEYNFHVVMLPEKSGKKGREVDLNSCVVLKPDEGELERIRNDIDNVVSAGWASIVVPSVKEYDVMTLPQEAVKTFSGGDCCTLLENGRQVRVPVEVKGVYGGTAVIRSGLSDGDVVVY